MTVLDRCQISQRNAVFILEAEAESLGYNIDELAINRNTIQRYREGFRKAKARKIKELFKGNETSFVSVPWGDKLISALNVRDLKSERLLFHIKTKKNCLGYQN